MNNHFDSANIIIMCAAVSDHRPRNKKGGKIKKNDFAKSIDLVENPDILKGLGKRKKKGQLLVGFAAEAENFVQNAKQKLIQKNLDWIAMNDISNASHGFGSDHNEIFLFSSTGEEVKLNSAPKNLLAKQILEEILKVKSAQSPLDKVLGKLDDLDEVNLGILVQRLANERKLLETVFDIIRDGILVLDDEGNICYANVQGRQLIGLKKLQSGQVSLQRASPEIYKAIGLNKEPQGLKAEVIVREMEISYPEVRFIRVYAVPIEEAFVKKLDSQQGGIAIILTDITEDKVSLDERIESEKISSIMDLAAEVAHELGNPLNSINIHLQVLKESLGIKKPIF